MTCNSAKNDSRDHWSKQGFWDAFFPAGTAVTKSRLQWKCGEKKDCITEMKQFIECIENATVLELTSFSFNKGKSFPQRERITKHLINS